MTLGRRSLSEEFPKVQGRNRSVGFGLFFVNITFHRFRFSPIVGPRPREMKRELRELNPSTRSTSFRTAIRTRTWPSGNRTSVSKRPCRSPSAARSKSSRWTTFDTVRLLGFYFSFSPPFLGQRQTFPRPAVPVGRRRGGIAAARRLGQTALDAHRDPLGRFARADPRNPLRGDPPLLHIQEKSMKLQVKPRNDPFKRLQTRWNPWKSQKLG